MTAAGVPAWDAEPGVRPLSLPELDGDARCDLCVVGLGASGLAAVEWAVSRGLDVIGVDAGRVGGGAAGRNAGFLLAGGAPPFHRAAARWGVEAALDLHRRTLDELDRLEAVLGPEVVRRTGSLRLAGLPPVPADPARGGGVVETAGGEDVTREVDDCRDQHAAMTAAGLAVEWYEGPLGVGLRFPRDGAVNPAQRCLVTAARLAEAARLHQRTPVLGVGGGARVRTPRGTVTAAAVVVCVDGGLERLVPALAGRVRTVRLQMVATRPVPPVLPCPVYARWGYDYAQQRPDGSVYVGGGRDRVPAEAVGDEVVPTPGVQAYLDTLVPRFAGRPVAVTNRWAGLVAYTPDEVPVCELVDDRVAVAGAYCGTGNLVGPVVARAAAALAVEGLPPDLPWPR